MKKPTRMKNDPILNSLWGRSNAALYFLLKNLENSSENNSEAPEARNMQSIEIIRAGSCGKSAAVSPVKLKTGSAEGTSP